MKNKLSHWVFAFSALLLISQGGWAQAVTITLEPSEVPISDVMWGLFYEDINLAADGGIYAEMVKNRSFEFPEILAGWSTSEEQASFVKVFEKSNKESDSKAIVIDTQSLNTALELNNSGFTGMGFKKGDIYHLSFDAKLLAGKNPELIFQFIDSFGKVIAETSVKVDSKEWTKYRAVLSPSRTEESGTLKIIVPTKTKIEMDWVSLFPDDTWMGRPNGLRKDLVQRLADLEPDFLRFPGGCIVEGYDLANRYKWKDTVGPIEDRIHNRNLWSTWWSHPDYHQSYGLGFYEYFLLSEDIGAEPLPILNCGISCRVREIVPMDEMDEYIQEALDLVEFANGSVDTEWGKLRAQMGHPEPFNMKYLGVGNESWGEEYFERYQLYEKVFEEKHPEIKLVICAFFHKRHPYDVCWEGIDRTNSPIADEHYYKSPKWFYDNVTRFDNYERKGKEIFVGEYACHVKDKGKDPMARNVYEAALAEAAFMTGMERNADLVTMAAYAPLFSNTRGVQWRPNLIWFDNIDSAVSPSYYVQQLFSIYKGDMLVNATSEGLEITGKKGLYASATQAKDGSIFLKIANKSGFAKKIDLDGSLMDGKKVTKIESLSGYSLKEFNSIQSGSPIVKKVGKLTPGSQLKVAPRSVTVFVIE